MSFAVQYITMSLRKQKSCSVKTSTIFKSHLHCTEVTHSGAFFRLYIQTFIGSAQKNFRQDAFCACAYKQLNVNSVGIENLSEFFRCLESHLVSAVLYGVLHMTVHGNCSFSVRTTPLLFRRPVPLSYIRPHFWWTYARRCLRLRSGRP